MPTSSAKYWSQIVDKKPSTTPFNGWLCKKYLPSKNARILDFGCGYGRIMDELKKDGYHNVCGVDISEGMIKECRRQHPNIELKVNTGTVIPYEDNVFDAVMLFGVLTCIIEDLEQEILLNEIHRVLKLFGIVYICDFLINYDERNMQRYKALQCQFPNNYQYGTFYILAEDVMFRHQTVEGVTHLTSEFKNESFLQERFKTLNGHEGNGFSYIGRKTPSKFAADTDLGTRYAYTST